MSSEQYTYDPPRKTGAYNYGGKHWKLSRSKISMYLKCKKCAYIDNVLGLAQPFGFPYNLNNAVDTALKSEADYIRSQIQAGQDLPFPLHLETMPTILEHLMEENDMRPLIHDSIPQWREAFEGVQTIHKGTGFKMSGALDDVWTTKDPNDDTLFVVDYKATAKPQVPSNLKSLLYEDYKRQIEVYQYLLRKNGFNVSSKGYIIYAIANKTPDYLHYALDFQVVLVGFDGNDSWVDGTVQEIKACFDRPKAEVVNIASGDDCNFCKYRGAFRKI